MGRAGEVQMKIDAHFHVAGNGTDIQKVDEDVYFYPDDNNLWFTRILYALVDQELKNLIGGLKSEGRLSTKQYLDLVYGILGTSEEIDSIVLLGLDAVFSPDTGERDDKRTDLWVSNRFLSKTIKALNDRLQNEIDPPKRMKRFFYGASVSPNRPDWREEMDFVANDPGAVLLKLIPSALHVDLMAPMHKEYYEFLSSIHMPLLCHVGPEYSFPEGIRRSELDKFSNLEGPLRHGVTVIAAHCATPVFPVVDSDDTQKFYTLMKKYNSGGRIQLWGDTSAFCLSTRVTIVREILKTFPAEWLVNGSDFPIPIDGWVHLPRVTTDISIEEYVQIQQTKNPIDKDIRIKRAHGFSDSILGNAEKILRLPNPPR
jgi:hypothetical protein